MPFSGMFRCTPVADGKLPIGNSVDEAGFLSFAQGYVGTGNAYEESWMLAPLGIDFKRFLA